MKRVASLLTAVLSIPACSYAGPGEPAPPQHAAEVPHEASPGSTVLDHARTLPPLVAQGGELALPLGGAEPHPWRPIRDGVTVTGGASLGVEYTRTRSMPAGAAMVIRPGDLAGLRELVLDVRGERSQTLYVTLTQADGSVWTTPPIRVTAGEERSVRLKAADITPDPYQNGGAPAGATFDAAQVYMLTLLDIGGYMSLAEPRCVWSVRSMKAVLR